MYLSYFSGVVYGLGRSSHYCLRQYDTAAMMDCIGVPLVGIILADNAER